MKKIENENVAVNEAIDVVEVEEVKETFVQKAVSGGKKVVAKYGKPVRKVAGAVLLFGGAFVLGSKFGKKDDDDYFEIAPVDDDIIADAFDPSFESIEG